MLEKLDKIEERYEELSRKIADPEVIADYSRWREYVKAHAEMEEVVHTYREYKKVSRDIENAEMLLREENDPELRDLAAEELELLKERKEELTERLKVLLLPKDPNDEKNVILEIRAGTGGEEAALFAADLLRMYLKFAERRGWRSEMMSSSPTDLGGFKEAIVLIEGRGAYSQLKFESGVHRVQRVPETEASGRIHTSAATVAVLPEAEEVDVAIDPKDLRIDVFCSTGPGGQSVNTTQSAVRITHLPTGIVVTCQDEKSQHKNRDKAMKVLRARLLDKMQREQQEKIAAARRSQVGTGDRSERIRTYNFPQNRVTDHRVGLTLYRLGEVLDGDLDELITALVTHHQAERLRQIS
ncbi:peptide chain release factor 1 (bRF-1) [Thermodesulfitimonas autotrophica]|uniref:Peptide chain release factor 1 n=1 Tax=Thermodesulfitimonas autotrophica TaxID=1894989 RepID=A0A3N5ADL3_9THEO|nr:peptide chain release factor 1 [Thermodesulfitimonas autotrophica]RPF42956.1 peptide chain release factor 1 (bRF-1) [Thermodesulfitimonas autotrophica]